MDDACATQARLTCGIDEIITEAHLMSVDKEARVAENAAALEVASHKFQVSGEEGFIPQMIEFETQTRCSLPVSTLERK